MKAVKPFFLGGVGGLALTLAIAIGIFLSPLRRALYLEWDPELSRLRSKTDQLRERMQAGELGMAEGAAAAAGAGQDSLRAALAGDRKEYRHWRNRLGELSRAHDEPAAADFPAWAYSLRYGLGPLAAVLSLVPALFFAVRAARRPAQPPRTPRPSKAPAKAPPRPPPAQEEALTSFQSAVKQVARIATPPLPAAARPVAAPRPDVPPAAAEDLSKEPSPYEVVSDNVFRAPAAGSATEGGTMPRPEAMETQIFQLGPGGWGEPRLSAEPDPAARPGNASGNTVADAAGNVVGEVAGDASGNAGFLPMEDEDSQGATGEETTAGTGAGGHFMPPTTEVERVERRKAEVVKLARKGMTSSEISRRLRISQDQVEFIIRMRREKG